MNHQTISITPNESWKVCQNTNELWVMLLKLYNREEKLKNFLDQFLIDFNRKNNTEITIKDLVDFQAWKNKDLKKAETVKLFIEEVLVNFNIISPLIWNSFVWIEWVINRSRNKLGILFWYEINVGEVTELVQVIKDFIDNLRNNIDNIISDYKNTVLKKAAGDLEVSRLQDTERWLNTETMKKLLLSVYSTDALWKGLSINEIQIMSEKLSVILDIDKDVIEKFLLDWSWEKELDLIIKDILLKTKEPIEEQTVIESENDKSDLEISSTEEIESDLWRNIEEEMLVIIDNNWIYEIIEDSSDEFENLEIEEVLQPIEEESWVEEWEQSFVIPSDKLEEVEVKVEESQDIDVQCTDTKVVEKTLDIPEESVWSNVENIVDTTESKKYINSLTKIEQKNLLERFFKKVKEIDKFSNITKEGKISSVIKNLLLIGVNLPSNAQKRLYMNLYFVSWEKDKTQKLQNETVDLILEFLVNNKIDIKDITWEVEIIKEIPVPSEPVIVQVLPQTNTVQITIKSDNNFGGNPLFKQRYDLVNNTGLDIQIELLDYLVKSASKILYNQIGLSTLNNIETIIKLFTEVTDFEEWEEIELRDNIEKVFNNKEKLNPKALNLISKILVMNNSKLEIRNLFTNKAKRTPSPNSWNINKQTYSDWETKAPDKSTPELSNKKIWVRINDFLPVLQIEINRRAVEKKPDITDEELMDYEIHTNQFLSMFPTDDLERIIGTNFFHRYFKNYKAKNLPKRMKKIFSVINESEITDFLCNYINSINLKN